MKGKKAKKQQEQQSVLFEEGKSEDKNLFEKLRQVRREVASEKGVPPYIIFGDRTLHQLATVQPTTRLAFGTVSGVGQHKQQQLGTTFVRAIREYKGLSTDEREDWNRI